VVIAAGVECMSLIPIGSQVILGLKSNMGHPYHSQGVKARYGEVQWTQFRGAELLAKTSGISREQLDEFAVVSHQRAAEATEKGHFTKEIVPVLGEVDGKEKLITIDEGFRKDTTLEKVKKLKLLNEDGGRHTAATASQISDGAAAVLIVNDRALKKYNLKPRARILAMDLAGSDPDIMLGGPIPATQKVLKRAGLQLSDMEIYEVNEAFGVVPLAWAKALNADMKKLNVNGGAQALGHPLGATGCKLIATLVHELERRGGRYGLQAICEGGGTANAIILERIPSVAGLKSKL